jgi:gamma-glutamyltranspeptidase/glutathione hydrolase
MPPPSSGGLTVMQMLGLLERFPLGDAAQGYGFGNPKTLHVMIEAMRLAFADRAVWIGDDDAVPLPRKGLLHPGYLATRTALIKADRRMETPQAGDPRPGQALHSTPERHVERPLPPTSPSSTAGATGELHQHHRVHLGIGTVPGHGFLLNNEPTDFTPFAANAAAQPGC